MSPDTPVEEVVRLKPEQKRALKRLKILTSRDLLYHFPSRYTSVAGVRDISSITAGESVRVFGELSKVEVTKTFRSRIPSTKARVNDETGTLDVIWFYQPYIGKLIQDGAFVKLEGKVSETKSGKLSMTNPEVEVLKDVPFAVGDSLFTDDGELLSHPVYPATKGVTSLWFHHTIKRLIEKGEHKNIPDPLPENICKSLSLPSLETALVWIHLPKKERDYQAARKRFAFEELFFLQVHNQKRRYEYQRAESYELSLNEDVLKEFISNFGFSLTKAQDRVLSDIFHDLKGTIPMSRLLEGDVGSGKTAVATAALFATVTAKEPEGLQAALMAPTGILANQHFETLRHFFREAEIPLGLITSSTAKIFRRGRTEEVSPKEVIEDVRNGSLSVVVGTHSLIQDRVTFNKLALVIVDEQHRFGIKQRKKLSEKGAPLPHLLSMTATPIPRTLALTLYGDLDLSVIDELPPGRTPVTTSLVPPNKREQVYEKVRSELQEGRQLYVICPRIFEPDPRKFNVLATKNVIEETNRLQKKVFKDYSVEMLHGKMSAEEKETIISRFNENEIQVLVSTSVIEVGINIPNATMIIIEGADRFGLSQLHQLRGRVARSTHQAFCYLFTDSENEQTLERLLILQRATNGFTLAEEDLKLRGAGELLGSKQSGVSDVAMEALRNIKMVEIAQREAVNLVQEDSKLDKYPELQSRVKLLEKQAHLE